MTKLILLLGLSLQLFCNCKEKIDDKDRVQTKLSTLLDTSFRKADSCFFRLRDIAAFEWEKMYIFRSYRNEEFISRYLGFEYNSSISPFVPHYYERLIFTSGTSVVYEEDMGPLSYEGNNINIDLPIDTTSFSTTQKAYTKLMYYFDSRKDSVIAYRIRRDKNGQKGYSYIISSVLDFNKTAIVNW